MPNHFKSLNVCTVNPGGIGITGAQAFSKGDYLEKRRNYAVEVTRQSIDRQVDLLSEIFSMTGTLFVVVRS